MSDEQLEKSNQEVLVDTSIVEADKKEKRFTPFQSIIIIISLVAVLTGFVALAIYFVKNSSDDRGSEKLLQSNKDDSIPNPSITSPVVSVDDSVVSTSSKTSEELINEAQTTEIKKPDLYVKNLVFDKIPQINKEFVAKITIGNKGNAESNNFVWEWWPDSYKKECKEDVVNIAPGGTKLVECKYIYTKDDEYSTKVILDSKDNVDEINENNNQYVKQLTVAKKADLYVSSYSFDHDPVQGEEFTVSITIKNKGETDAEDFYWEWWPTITGSKACRDKIKKLEAGDNKTVKCDYTYGGWANYTTKAVVDSENNIEEINEDNNTYTKNVIPIH